MQHIVSSSVSQRTWYSALNGHHENRNSQQHVFAMRIVFVFRFVFQKNAIIISVVPKCGGLMIVASHVFSTIVMLTDLNPAVC